MQVRIPPLRGVPYRPAGCLPADRLPHRAITTFDGADRVEPLTLVAATVNR